MTTETLKPIICKGTGTQPPCKHYRPATPTLPAGCEHPDNMRPDLENGGLRRFAAIFWRRDIGEPCGPLAHQYEPNAPM